MDTCQYKDALGIPGEGVHSARIGGLAAVDVVGTVFAALAINWWYDGNLQGFWMMLIFIIILATLLHWLFCVPTAGLQALGINV